MAAAVGIGPTSRHLECPVLPLNDTAVCKNFRIRLSETPSVFPLCQKKGDNYVRVVGERGIEPPISHERGILSPLHIPVLPLPRIEGVLGTGRHP